MYKTIRYSPYESLYGRTAHLPIHTRAQYFSFNRRNDYFEQLRKTLHILHIYHQAAKHHIRLLRQSSNILYDHNRENPQYRIGDKVLIDLQSIPGKLEPKFSAIFRTISRLNHPIYEVRDEPTNLFWWTNVVELLLILVNSCTFLYLSFLNISSVQ